MAGDEIYPLGRWVVKAGQEATFIEAWKDLGEFFLSLPEPPGLGTLVQSTDNPSLFYSFGPWPSAQAAAEMRGNPDTPAVMGRLAALCEEATPGMFSLVATVGG